MTDVTPKTEDLEAERQSWLNDPEAQSEYQDWLDGRAYDYEDRLEAAREEAMLLHPSNVNISIEAVYPQGVPF